MKGVALYPLSGFRYVHRKSAVSSSLGYFAHPAYNIRFPLSPQLVRDNGVNKMCSSNAGYDIRQL